MNKGQLTFYTPAMPVADIFQLPAGSNSLYQYQRQPGGHRKNA